MNNEKIEIEVDKVWYTVLQLTSSLQRQNLTLYKYNNRNLNIGNE